MTRRTPLHAVHEKLGATFTDFAGWTMPVRYASDLAEHHAVRSAAGLFDLSHMGELEMTGSDVAVALDHALVGRPSAIGPGRARYSMLCAEDGGILDDLVVYRLAEQRYLIVANAGNTSVVREALIARSAGLDVRVHDATDEWALIAVQGPRSAAILDEVVDLDVSTIRYYAIDETSLAGRSVLLARTGYTGEDGFEVYCRSAEAAGVWTSLTQAGAGLGLVPAGLACRDTLRLEAGMPLYGHELSRALTPFEARLDRVVSFDKPGGFVGEDALRARRERAPERVLVGLVASGRRAPRSGCAVLDHAGGTQVGEVTSGALSPTLGHPVALAYVARGLALPGTLLAVDVRGRHEDVEVVPLPFYRRRD